ncbi:MAG: nuclear transport factor 2 family protein [Candidatus Acidiferrales bacterium]
MKRSVAVISLIAVLCPLVWARPGAPAPKPEDEIAKLERDWLAAEAAGDLATLRGLIADDFIGTSVGPGVLTKDDIVPATEEDGAGRLPKSSLRESTVRVFGDCAVLMGYIAFDDVKQPGGLRVTSVYQKRGGRWQMIAAQLSPDPAVH